MIMKKSKLISVLSLIVFAFLFVVAGCGGNTGAADKTTGQDQTTQAATTQATTVAQEPVTINFTTFRADDEAVMKKLIEKFESENPLIKINYDPQKDSGAYYQTLKANVLTGEGVDVFDIHPSVDYASFIREGYMADLSALDFNGNYMDGAKTLTTIDGKNYGYLNGVNMILCFYNKEIFKEVGVDVPKDFNDLVSIVGKLKEKNYGGIAYCGGDVKGVWMAAAMMNEEGGPENYNKYVTDIDTGVMTNIKDNAAIYSAMKTLSEINKSKILYDNSASVKYDQSLALFAQKKAAIMMMGTWVFGTSETDFPGIDYGIFAFPTLNKSNVAYAEPAQITCVFSKSKYLEQAQKFVNFLATPENTSIYIGAAKMTTTIKGVNADFKGSEMLSEQMEKGVNVLPIVNVKNTDLWQTATFTLYENILLKGADVDKEIASLEEILKKADLKNKQ